MRLKACLVILCGCSLGVGLSPIAMGATAATAKTTSTVASDRSNKVFRIGAFDFSSSGFAAGAPKGPVSYVVGESHAEKDWYAKQPAVVGTGAEKASSNAKAAPRSILFSLANPPARAYRLHLSFLIETPSVPSVRVTINGRHGNFYLQPRLDTNAGDGVGTFDPIYSHAEVVFDFPGSYLHAGKNTIQLQAFEDADQAVPDAGLTYDAVELSRQTGGLPSTASSAEILPTIFYQKRDGKLVELVDVLIHHGKPVRQGDRVDLTLDRNRYQQPFAVANDFGEEKLEFAVPEFSAKTQAHLQWTIGGQQQRKEQSIDPAKKWTLFMVPHIHLDVGYSDYQAKVAAIQSRVIDEAMELTAQHPDFRFSLDGDWTLEQFMKTRTPVEQQRAITAIQKKQLFVPAQYANLLTGFSTAETLIRSLYPSANFSRTHGTPFNYANITDVPSYSWSYASILASAGIKYFFAGSDNVRGPVLLQGHLNLHSPMWWQGPDGQKVLLWYSRHYMQMQLIFGLPPLLSAGRDALPLFLQQYEEPSYRANATIIFGTQVENTDLFPQQAELAQKWNDVYAYPHMQYSGFHEALENIAQQFGSDIPTVNGDGGPYWEDGIASDAYYAAMERQNESRGPSAEKLSTLTSLVNPRVAADKKGLDRMWKYMVLMDEHTMDSFNSISQPTSMEAVKQLEVKNLFAVKADALADFLTRNSMASIADSISAGKGSLIVFNTLNWERSGPVSLDLSDGQEIVDLSTGQVVPYAVLRNGNGFHHVRFIAQDIPAVGYKVFDLRPTEAAVPPAVSSQSTVLESPYYRVELDPATGSVRSIYDKQLQRELVNRKSPYRFGQYLYVDGSGRAPSTTLVVTEADAKAGLQIHPSHDGKLISVTHTPYGWAARMESTDTNTPQISTEVQLFDHQKKIEITENLEKKDVTTKEGVYFAFPFAMEKPQFQYEIQTGVVDPAKDMYPGAGHEWFSVQHWVSVQQDGVSATVMPLDASLVTLGDINRGAWPTQFGQRPGNIFSYVMNNYWFTNYRAGQGGHFRFRYVITSAPSTDAAALSRMGWEEMTPLEKDKVTSQDKALDTPRRFSGKQGSFLHVSDPNVVLDTWKPAEDGEGTVLRFLDLGGATRTVTVKTPLLQVEHVWQTDAVERNQKPLTLVGTNGFEFTLHPHEIVTVRMVGRPDVAVRR